MRGSGVVRLAVAAAALAGTLPASPAVAQSCSERVDATAFASASRIRELNEVMADTGERPTASPAHHRYVRWLEHQLGRVEGVTVRSRHEHIDRWLERSSSLTVVRDGGDKELVRIAGAVPYSTTGANTTVRGPLTYIPPGTPVAGSDVEGKIVLRDALPGAGPQAIFFAVADYVHDSDASIDYAGEYERDFSGYVQRVVDLQDAKAEGAAGILFAHNIPHEQVRGNYQPYNGVFWDVAGVFVGVDEGESLKEAAAAGAAAELDVAATLTDGVPSPTLIGALPGQSDERIVIASHTDGMNAVWDNGPTAILALAEYLADLPLECRPRTFEFVLSTSHLYLSENGAHNYAHEELDPAYDEGTVVFAVALEHLGAREWLYIEREDGPGFELRPTGESEQFVTFTNESAASKEALISSVIERDIRRTWVLRGADGPVFGADPCHPRFPPHHSYGGEGGAYHQALLPTIAGITGPNTLFNPAFGIDELVDFELMRRQMMAFGDAVLKLQDLPREVVAGADTAYRAGRDNGALGPLQNTFPGCVEE